MWRIARGGNDPAPATHFRIFRFAERTKHLSAGDGTRRVMEFSQKGDCPRAGDGISRFFRLPFIFRNRAHANVAPVQQEIPNKHIYHLTTVEQKGAPWNGRTAVQEIDSEQVA